MNEIELKAREIVIKMQFQNPALMIEQAKHCAKIAVDEIISELVEFDKEDGYAYHRIDFFEKIKIVNGNI